MGIIERLIGGRALTPATADPGPATIARRGPVFAGTSIDPGTLYGVASLDEALAEAPQRRVSRSTAISVPAIKRARDIVCAGLGSLPLRLYDPAGAVVPWALLDQPETSVASVITWTNVADDMFFDGAAWLAVRAYGVHGRPAEVLRLDPDSVSVPQHTITVQTHTGSGTAQVYAPDPLLIRIDSPIDPIRVAGARAIRTLYRLERAALDASDGVPPQDWFTPTSDGDNPFAGEDEDEEARLIQEFLDDWTKARGVRRTGWVPTGVDYHSNQINPRDLQLVEGREMAITEIARLTGVDPEDLAVHTTSRDYFNGQDRRRDRLDFTLGPFARALEGRLSMDDVTPPGYTVRVDPQGFLATDDKTAAETDEILLRADIETLPEIRARRGLAARDVAPTPATDRPKEIA